MCSDGGGRYEEGGREEESGDRRRSEAEGRVGGEGAEGVGVEKEREGKARENMPEAGPSRPWKQRAESEEEGPSLKRPKVSPYRF